MYAAVVLMLIQHVQPWLVITLSTLHATLKNLFFFFFHFYEPMATEKLSAPQQLVSVH